MLNTPIIVLAVLVVVVAVNALLFFGFYLPRTSTPAADPVLVGAGDIADCSSSGDEATAKLLGGISGTIYTTGDNAYESGTASEFSKCYAPTWGRYKVRTKPSVGNHDYYTPGASGYFDYFGSAAGDPQKGYYSYDLGEWHVVSLNSMCAQVGGCGAHSPMVRWLEQKTWPRTPSPAHSLTGTIRCSAQVTTATTRGWSPAGKLCMRPTQRWC